MFSFHAAIEPENLAAHQAMHDRHMERLHRASPVMSEADLEFRVKKHDQHMLTLKTQQDIHGSVPQQGMLFAWFSVQYPFCFWCFHFRQPPACPEAPVWYVCLHYLTAFWLNRMFRQYPKTSRSRWRHQYVCLDDLTAFWHNTRTLWDL